MTSPTSDSDDAYWQRPDPAADSLGRPDPSDQGGSTVPGQGGPGGLGGTGGPGGAGGAGGAGGGGGGGGGGAQSYTGPPRTDPPAPGWRPPTIAHPPPPRSMPAQDIDALDEAEGSARTVTYGVGLVAGAVGIILICLLCARVFF
ncbi:translation initiation factor 2 [Actinoplanes sp. NPDC023714]|uniref:translation initiation factor 2 n=1 Tax=Actinoplanes sp. NPDC023714 TaxID=3154322 RepID=UPI0033D331A0